MWAGKANWRAGWCARGRGARAVGGGRAAARTTIAYDLKTTTVFLLASYRLQYDGG